VNAGRNERPQGGAKRGREVLVHSGGRNLVNRTPGLALVEAALDECPADPGFQGFSLLLRDVLFPEDSPRVVLVVRRAEQAELVGDREPTLGERLDVLDGEMSTFAAAPALSIHERAL
jgi:hypothetical protein